MATPLTRDEQQVLHHLLSGEASNEIADTLGLPLQVVRTCVHTLIQRLLDETLSRAASSPSGLRTTDLPAPP
jgi:DNA-binding NarL/FixJ family response regulator